MAHRGQPYRVCKLVYYGRQAVEHSESKHTPGMTIKLHRERKAELCGVLLDLAVKNRQITKCFKQTWYCNTVLIVSAFRFQYKRSPLHVVLDHLLGKTSHYTSRAQAVDNDVPPQYKHSSLSS